VRKILIIDDDPSGTLLLATLLGLKGYQPVKLENWKEPIEDLEQHRPDLALMDIYLRTTNGFDLLRRIRAHPDADLARTPVLMMSAEDQCIRCEQEGADGFLEKPFNIRVLVEAIRGIEEGSLSKD
jgi:DNA-binding response OmpR family regulator